MLLARLPVPAKLFGARAPFVAAIRDYKIRLGTARGLRLADASIDAFYTSHTLEHLSRNDCEELLRRVHRWLKPNGVLRVVLPDLRSLASSYVSGGIDADTFMAHTHLATKGSQWLGIGVGHSRHCWLYDCDSFMALLGRLAYRDVKRSHFGSSSLPQLASLDLKVRENGSFYVEAVK